MCRLTSILVNRPPQKCLFCLSESRRDNDVDDKLSLQNYSSPQRKNNDFILFDSTQINKSKKSGPVLLRRHVRNKNEPLVDEVFLLEANPHYAQIRYSDGRETTVSTTDIAPLPADSADIQSDFGDEGIAAEAGNTTYQNDTLTEATLMDKNRNITESSDRVSGENLGWTEGMVKLSNPPVETNSEPPEDPLVIRKSGRIRNPPDRLTYYH